MLTAWIKLVLAMTVAAEGGETGLEGIKECEGDKCKPIEQGYCRRIESGYCTDSVVLYDLRSSEKNPVLLVNCAVGSVLTIQLPRTESLQGEPVLGNAALFQATSQPESKQVLVWPTIPKEAKVTPDDLADAKSNIQLNLESGISVLVQLRITSFETAVQRIVLRYPEREKELGEREQLKDVLRKEVEKEYEQMARNLEAEAHRRATVIIAQDVLKRANCESLSEREMKDLLLVKADQICQLGDHLFLRFTVHNRARDMFTPQSVEVLGVEGKQLKPFDAVIEWEGAAKPVLRFDQKASGVAMVPVSEESVSAEYALRVTESAGKKRVVVLEGIEF